MRNNFNLDLIGKVAADMDDMSPLQVGTEGRFQNRAFTLAGRLKVRWQDGTWNEWYAIFDDGSEGWLAEFMGWFTMSFRSVIEPETVEALLAFRHQNEPPLGAAFHFDNKKFAVADAREAWYVGSEGELPFKAMPNERSYNLDLRDDRGGFASVEFAEGELRAYTGAFVPFSDFHFRNLRPLEGWPEPHTT